MISFSRRTLEVATAIAVGVIPVVLYTMVFDHEIPRSVPGDIDARVYPDALIYIWFGLTVAHILEALFADRSQRVTILSDAFAHAVKMFLIIGGGFLLLVFVGYIVAGFFYIVAFAYILNERSRVVWLVAAIVPIAVYVFLEATLDVRLPTVLDLWR